MKRPTWEQGAKIGITVQFLALVRILTEYFRLRHMHGERFSLAMAEPYVTGALICAVLCWLAVGLFFFRRSMESILVAVATVLVLLAYRFFVMG